MNPTAMKTTASFHGIIPPMVTPLVARDQLDQAGLERLVEHLIAGGVCGLFLLGTTGEGPSLGYAVRRELISRTCRQVADRVAVLVGITDTSFTESVAIARHAAEAGADAVVLAPPYYLPPAQPELLEYLQRLVSELPLPLFLYNIPSLTKVTFEPDTVRRAMDEPRIIGLKDSSGSMIYFHKLCGLLHYRSDWSLLMGLEELLCEAIAAGAHGGVCGGANVFPRLYVSLYEAAIAHDQDAIRCLHERVMHVTQSLYQVGRHPSAIIKGIKCALSCLGICDDFMADPFRRFRAEERARIAIALKELAEQGI
jgi:4-hydroxy-tetrahydrodipicolinate synthase